MRKPNRLVSLLTMVMWVSLSYQGLFFEESRWLSSEIQPEAPTEPPTTNLSSRNHKVPITHPHKVTKGAKKSEAIEERCKTVEFPRPFDGWDVQPNVYQVSGKFGVENMFEAQVMSHRNRTVNTGVVDNDKVFGYFAFPEFIRDDPTWENNLRFLSNQRDKSRTGGGYWFWKARLIHHHLHLMEEGDFLVYVDADLNQHVRLLAFYLEEMVEKGKNLALLFMRDELNELRYTKRDVYEAYCHKSPEEMRLMGQFDAAFVILRKDKATMKFVQQWLEGVKHFHALSDEKSWLPNFGSFREHRRDQSILNIITKCRYGLPQRESFSSACRSPGRKLDAYGTVELFTLPVMDDAKMDAMIHETADMFQKLEELFKEASEDARRNPEDPYWYKYLAHQPSNSSLPQTG